DGGGSDGALPETPRNLHRTRPEHVDDLQRIRGIGAGFQQKLNELGIYQLEQIAGLNEAEIVWVEDALKMFRGRVGRDDWIGQARDRREREIGTLPCPGAPPALRKPPSPSAI